MIIVGAKGHAQEVLDVLNEQNIYHNLFFFDNISVTETKRFYNYPLIKNFKDAQELFRNDNRFILALGGTKKRYDLVLNLRNSGGKLTSIISKTAYISKYASMGDGINLMKYSSVFGNAIIEDAVLMNSYCSVHHDAIVGAFSELSPGSRILGNARVGKMCSIGTNAVILPGISVIDKVIIGAGSVVTRDITEEGTYIGAPAIKIK